MSVLDGLELEVQGEASALIEKIFAADLALDIDAFLAALDPTVTPRLEPRLRRRGHVSA
jgi:hypothetical protein